MRVVLKFVQRCFLMTFCCYWAEWSLNEDIWWGKLLCSVCCMAKRCGLIGCFDWIARKFFSGWNIGLHVLGFG